LTETQLILDSGAWGRDEALRALRSKYAAWLDAVGTPTLYALCRRVEVFTTDDVWDAFGQYPGPGERRVMGALIRGFALKGVIVKTGETEKSLMPACHARDKALWKSLIYTPPLAARPENDSSNGTEYGATP
jgi:hypothetical protein